MSEQIRGILRRAKEIHLELKISSHQLQKYLDFLKVKAAQKPKFAPCGGCMSEKIEVRPALQRAFNSLKQKQRADFYLRNVLIAKQVLEGEEKETVIPQDMKTTSWYFFNEAQKDWQTKSIQIDFNKLIIKLRSTKEELDLHNYIVRASKKKDESKSILALQSIETLQLPQTIRISNFKDNFQEFSKLVVGLIEAGIRENIERMVMADSNLKTRSNISVKMSKHGSRQFKDLNQLNKQNSTVSINLPTQDENLVGEKSGDNTYIFKTPDDRKRILNHNTSFPLLKNQIEKDDLKFKTKLFNSLTNTQDLQSYRKNVMINIKENRVRKIYEYKQQDSPLPFEWFSDNFMVSSCFRRWKKTLKDSRTLSFNRESFTKIFYELHEYKDQSRVSYIYKREKVLKDSNCLYFIDTPVNNTSYETANGKIEYVIWKFERRYSLLEIMVEGMVTHGDARMGYPSIQLTDEFLGSMDYICVNLNMTLGNETDFNINSVMFEEEFLSQIDIFKDVPDDDDFYSIGEDDDEDQMQSVPSKRVLRRPSDNISIQYKNSPSPQHSLYSFKPLAKSQHLTQPQGENLLKYRHPMLPYPKGQPSFKKPKREGEHPFFENEFTFTKEGEMVSINQEKLKAQSSVLKSVLKTISKNIFSGKSILSISLPVTVFSVESNLSLICKSYAYAPLLLEKAAKESDPVNRMKYVAAFVVTIIIAYLQMDKPFNPILGQTFQGLFDGCVVYGEQVSHHPPISSTFMVGRGYKLYGSFEAKVNMSLNSATGSNEGILHISFDQKDLQKKLYKVIYPPGQMTGLTFGTRKVATTGKSFILDIENRVYLQLNYNRHKGTTQYCKFYDGVEGKIVQLSPDADISKIDKINKKAAIKEYGIFCGRWTKELFFEDELLFDCYSNFSHAFEQYSCPLQSDAYLRQDLKRRVANDFDSAQSAKEMLEEIQRKDRQLRKKYHG